MTSEITRFERACHDMLKAALRVKDLYGQGLPVTPDTLDLCERTFDVVARLPTAMCTGPVLEREQLGLRN
jgi:hypothetical protein